MSLPDDRKLVSRLLASLDGSRILRRDLIRLYELAGMQETEGYRRMLLNPNESIEVYPGTLKAKIELAASRLPPLKKRASRKRE